MNSRLLILSVLLSFSLVLSAEPGGEVAVHRFDPVDAARERTVPLKVYLTPSSSPVPVILFSHGLGGSRENNTYLGEHWARHGYVAVFLQHAGSDEQVWKTAGRGERMSSLKQAANLQSSIDRFADVPFVLDQLEKWNSEAGHALAGKLDLDHIGMCGHSFGAVTTQAVMGQKFRAGRTVADPRLDAFLPMSPSVGRGMTPEDSFGHIQAPVLCMTGTKDGNPLDPNDPPDNRQKVFAALPSGDKYHLVFEEGHHFAFSDSAFPGYEESRIAHHHEAILKISTRFWDAYLKGDSSAKTWLQSETVRQDCSLVDADVWTWK